MKTATLLLVLLVAAVSAFTEVEYRDVFTNWMQEQNKAYTSEEFQARFEVFRSNMDYVEQWNAEHDEPKLGLNNLADLSNAEYRQYYLGTRVEVTEKIGTESAFSYVGALPDAVDWRTKGAVTPIKDQGQCGSCWSFSTTGSVEGAHQIASGNLVSLSEQNLMDCSTPQGNAGCNGGLMDNAFKYIIQNKGIDTEASYPYTAKDGTSCKYNPANIGATISSYKDVLSKNETALQAAVATVGPVSVAIDASHTSFQLYKSGVYHQLLCSSTKLDHGVLAVGYGADGASDYWIVKNSWGTSWGQLGYIWMSRNKSNNCGIATMASYPIV